MGTYTGIFYRNLHSQIHLKTYLISLALVIFLFYFSKDADFISNVTLFIFVIIIFSLSNSLEEGMMIVNDK